MPPGQQVRDALWVLKPPANQRKACRAAIKNALAIMAEASIAHNVFAAQRSKAHSKAQRAYHSALRRLRAATKALLDAGGAVAIDLDLDRIKREIRATEPRRLVVYRGTGIVPDGALVRVGGTKPTFAVALAYELIEQWKGKPTTTRKGDWWYLASILYGKPRDKPIDLFQKLRDFDPELSPFRRGRG